MDKKQVVMERFHIHDEWALCVEATFLEGRYDHTIATTMYDAMQRGAMPALVQRFIDEKFLEEPELFIGGVP